MVLSRYYSTFFSAKQLFKNPIAFAFNKKTVLRVQAMGTKRSRLWLDLVGRVGR